MSTEETIETTDFDDALGVVKSLFLDAEKLAANALMQAIPSYGRPKSGIEYLFQEDELPEYLGSPIDGGPPPPLRIQCSHDNWEAEAQLRPVDLPGEVQTFYSTLNFTVPMQKASSFRERMEVYWEVTKLILSLRNIDYIDNPSIKAEWTVWAGLSVNGRGIRGIPVIRPGEIKTLREQWPNRKDILAQDFFVYQQRSEEYRKQQAEWLAEHGSPTPPDLETWEDPWTV